MARLQVAHRRLRPALACAAYALLGCYQSWSDEDAADARDAHPDRSDDGRHDDAAIEDFALDEAGPEADALPECPPEPGDGTWLSFTVDDDPYVAVDLALDCEVAAVDRPAADTSSILLRCDDPSGPPLHVFRVSANPHPPLASLEGRRVFFRHVAETWFEGIDRHVLLRQTDASGTLLLALTDSWNLSPSGIDASAWYRPYAVALAEGACPVLPDPCGRRERQALDVSFGAEAGRFFDGCQGTLGARGRLWVHVGVAHRYHELTCVDYPRTYYQLLFALIEDD